MPSLLHESIARLFQQQPALAAALLRDRGRELPEFDDARLEPAELNNLVPVEFTADALIVLRAAGAPGLALVVEVQLRRDDDKPWAWPVYVATARHKMRCPVWLLVVCPSEGAAQACREPFEFWGPAVSLSPLVLGPAEVPIVTAQAEARRLPHLAVLSTLTHRRSPQLPGILQAAIEGLQELPVDQARTYTLAIARMLPRTALAEWEALMAVSKLQKLLDEDTARAEARGEANAVLALLEGRGIAVPAQTRARCLPARTRCNCGPGCCGPRARALLRTCSASREHYSRVSLIRPAWRPMRLPS